MPQKAHRSKSTSEVYTAQLGHGSKSTSEVYTAQLIHGSKSTSEVYTAQLGELLRQPCECPDDLGITRNMPSRRFTARIDPSQSGH